MLSVYPEYSGPAHVKVYIDYQLLFVDCQSSDGMLYGCHLVLLGMLSYYLFLSFLVNIFID